MNLGNFLMKLEMDRLFESNCILFKPNLIKLINMKTKILSYFKQLKKNVVFPKIWGKHQLHYFTNRPENPVRI